MTKDGSDLLGQLLANAVASQQSGEQHLREFAAAAADDQEVQTLFSECADAAKLHGQHIGARLAQFGAPEPSAGQAAGAALAAVPQIALTARVPEEHLLHSLIFASAMKARQCALYESLVAAAAAAGDPATESLAREIERNEQKMLERVRHFIPSRSKIAFNMLTISEVDPAVETKAKDDRLES